MCADGCGLQLAARGLQAQVRPPAATAPVARNTPGRTRAVGGWQLRVCGAFPPERHGPRLISSPPGMAPERFTRPAVGYAKAERPAGPCLSLSSVAALRTAEASSALALRAALPLEPSGNRAFTGGTWCSQKAAERPNPPRRHGGHGAARCPQVPLPSHWKLGRRRADAAWPAAHLPPRPPRRRRSQLTHLRRTQAGNRPSVLRTDADLTRAGGRGRVRSMGRHHVT
jgi:hypothetical protein